MSEASSAAPGGAPASGEAAPGGAAPGSEQQAAPLAIGAPEAGAPAGDAASAEGKPAASANVVSYEKTGDVGLDMALEFVGARGFGPDSPEMKAATNGDFSLLRAKLGALGDKAAGYENMLALAEKSHKDGAVAAKAKADADATLIHTAVGGKEQWANISKWAGENAEPAEKEAVNAALKAGGLQAKITAQWLAQQYNKATGTVVKPDAVTNADAAGKPDPVGPVTAQEFAKESQVLRAKLGVNFEKTPQYQALVTRRNAGRRAGK